jgi:hypothetical protein
MLSRSIVEERPFMAACPFILEVPFRAGHVRRGKIYQWSRSAIATLIATVIAAFTIRS